jgi:hypothetical protein
VHDLFLCAGSGAGGVRRSHTTVILSSY